MSSAFQWYMMYGDPCIENFWSLIGNIVDLRVWYQLALRRQYLDHYCYDFFQISPSGPWHGPSNGTMGQPHAKLRVLVLAFRRCAGFTHFLAEIGLSSLISRGEYDFFKLCKPIAYDISHYTRAKLWLTLMTLRQKNMKFCTRGTPGGGVWLGRAQKSPESFRSITKMVRGIICEQE